MRLTARLDDVLVTRSHLRVLRALDSLPVGVPASGRQVARRAGISHTAASRALAGLAAEVRRGFGGRLNTIIATGPIGKLTQPRTPGRELWRRIEREGVPVLSGVEP